MSHRVGYVPLRELLTRLDPPGKLILHGDSLPEIWVPEGRVAVAVANNGITGGIRPLHAVVEVAASERQAHGWGVYMLSKTPQEHSDYHCDVRFLGQKAAAESDDQRTALSLSSFNSPAPTPLPKQGTILLRFSAGDHRSTLGVVQLAGPQPLGQESFDALRFAGLGLQRWSYLALGTPDQRSPTDLILEGHFGSIRNEVFLMASGWAHALRLPIIGDLCRLLALTINPARLPTLLVYSPCFKRELLVDFGVLPSNSNQQGHLPEDYPTEEPHPEDSEPIRQRSSLVDVLGRYFPADRQATLYPQMIAVCAHQLGMAVPPLEQIVEIHELAHAICHTGLDLDAGEWVSFSSAPSSIAERFAQCLTYKLIRGNSELEAVFEKLEEHQPREYRDWRAMGALPGEEFRRQLLAAREA